MDRFEERLLTGAVGGLAVGWSTYAASRFGVEVSTDSLKVVLKTYHEQYDSHDALTSAYLGSIAGAAILNTMLPIRKFHRAIRNRMAQNKADKEIANLNSVFRSSQDQEKQD